MVSNLLVYSHLSLPENIDEIGNEIMKMYYPSGKVEDNSHLKTVEVCYIKLFVI